jgi:HPt (histidine-containing phosphotransfer) domain-containing protein
MVAGTADWRSKEVFDRAVFDRLDEETGGAGLEIAAALLSVAPGRRDAMIAAAAEGRTADLAKVAHTAKSGARSLGLVRLSELCDAIEHAPPADAEGLAALAPVVRQEFDAAIAVIAALQDR